MALLNIFKKKKPVLVRNEEKEEKKEVREKTEKTIFNDAYKIMKLPHITEKATDLLKINQYVFNVWERANKTEIKKAVEALYGVDVMSVRIINIPEKQRRTGRTQGWKKGYKKTLVRIKEGQKIEVLPR